MLHERRSRFELPARLTADPRPGGVLTPYTRTSAPNSTPLYMGLFWCHHGITCMRGVGVPRGNPFASN